MTKTELFKTIKEANKIVDLLDNAKTHTKSYYDLIEALQWTVQAMQYGYHPWYDLRVSKRTGHYYVTFNNR